MDFGWPYISSEQRRMIDARQSWNHHTAHVPQKHFTITKKESGLSRLLDAYLIMDSIKLPVDVMKHVFSYLGYTAQETRHLHLPIYENYFLTQKYEPSESPVFPYIYENDNADLQVTLAFMVPWLLQKLPYYMVLNVIGYIDYAKDITNMVQITKDLTTLEQISVFYYTCRSMKTETIPIRPISGDIIVSAFDKNDMEINVIRSADKQGDKLYITSQLLPGQYVKYLVQYDLVQSCPTMMHSYGMTPMVHQPTGFMTNSYIDTSVLQVDSMMRQRSVKISPGSGACRPEGAALVGDWYMSIRGSGLYGSSMGLPVRSYQSMFHHNALQNMRNNFIQYIVVDRIIE